MVYPILRRLAPLLLLFLPCIAWGSGISSSGGSGVSVYPATGTASFPYGASVSTFTVNTAINLTRNLVDIRTTNASACTGSSHDDGPLLTALDASTSAYLLIASTSCYINTATTLNNPLLFSSSATLNGTAAITLAYPPVAGPQKIFSLVGTSSVTIIQGNVSVYAEWWGANTAPNINGPFTDSGPAFQNADHALINGGHIQGNVGVYQIGSSVTINNASLSGQGFYTNNNGTLFLASNAFAATSNPMFTINTQNTLYDNFMIAGNIDPASFTAIKSGSGYGGNTLSHLYMKLVGIGIYLTVDNGSLYKDIWVVSASSACILTGGTTTAVGDDHWNQIVLEPRTFLAHGWIMDGNTSAMYIQKLVELGGINGIWVRGLNGVYGGAILQPSNLNLWNSIVNANSGVGIRLDSNLNAVIQNNTINGNGVNVGVYGSTVAWVDGIELDNNFMDGATYSNVDISSGMNVTINGGTAFNESSSSPSIHVGVKTSGLIKITNVMCGVPGEWGNTPDSGNSCLTLDTGALNSANNLGGTAVTGALYVTGNYMNGSATTNDIVDNSVAASKVIGPNNTKNGNQTTGNFIATKFMSTPTIPILGNFVSSATASGGSSVTVTLNGYSHYIVKVDLVNATGASGSVFMRFNTDSSSNYSYSQSGWALTASTGASCGNTAANNIALTSVGAANNSNNFGAGVRFTGTLNVDLDGVGFTNGTTMWQEKTGNNVTNLSIGGNLNSGSLTSLQVWVGSATSCTSVTDPLTGTTGSVWVWGAI